VSECWYDPVGYEDFRRFMVTQMTLRALQVEWSDPLLLAGTACLPAEILRPTASGRGAWSYDRQAKTLRFVARTES